MTDKYFWVCEEGTDKGQWIRADADFIRTHSVFGKYIEAAWKERWYTQNIESGLRAVVKLLRDNGINTYYSCHHSMTIEAESYDGTDLERVYNLLVDGGYDGFTIEIILVKAQGERLERRLLLEFHRCPVCDNVPTGFLYPEGG